MFRLQVDDTVLLSGSKTVGWQGSLQTSSGVPQVLLGLEGWEVLDFWVDGPLHGPRCWGWWWLEGQEGGRDKCGGLQPVLEASRTLPAVLLGHYWSELGWRMPRQDSDLSERSA